MRDEPTSAFENTAPQAGYLVAIDIKDIVPLDAQTGVYPAKTVPDILTDPLFGDVDVTDAEIALYGGADQVPPMKTYAILDAAKFSGGVGEFESCDDPYKCLFKGEAEDALQDVAPYLFELSPDSSFTRRLMTHDPDLDDTLTSAHLWHTDPGIYIRTRASFDDVWKHFRKFTHVQNEVGKWFYFRFWEAQHMAEYFYALRQDLTQVQRWFLINGQVPFTVFVPDAEESRMSRISPVPHIPLGRPGQSFRIGQLETDILTQSKKTRFVRKLTKYLNEESTFLARMDHPQQIDLVKKLMEHAFYYNIRIEQAVANFALASLIFGRPLDGDPVMAQFLNARIHQNDKARHVLSEARKRPAQEV